MLLFRREGGRDRGGKKGFYSSCNKQHKEKEKERERERQKKATAQQQQRRKRRIRRRGGREANPLSDIHGPTRQTCRFRPPRQKKTKHKTPRAMSLFRRILEGGNWRLAGGGDFKREWEEG